MDVKIMFFLVFSLIFTLLHLYLGSRLIGPAAWSRRGKGLAWGLVGVVLFFQMAVNVVYRSWGTAPIPGWLYLSLYAMYIIMGLNVLLLLLFLGRDLLRLFQGLARRVARPAPGGPSSAVLENPGRRQFLSSGVNAGLVGVSVGLSGVGFYGATTQPRVDTTEISIPGLHPDLDGLRIVHLTDLHVGPTLRRPFVESVVETTLTLKPDLIAMTGDMVDGFPDLLRVHLEPLRQLKAPHGVYWVTGNHEYYWGVEAWCEEARRLGFDVLVNEHRLVRRGNGILLVGGIPDHEGGRFLPGHRPDPFKTLAGAPEASARILLAHQPRSCVEAAKAGFDLQLSGHTHGGQFVPWNFLVRLQQPFVSGLDRHETLQVYTSRGTGYWGPPLRLGIPSEIAVLILRSGRV